jgi:hypothetical protein
LACHEELYLGGWEKGNVTDEVWKAAQFGSCKFVGIAVELGWEGLVCIRSFVVLMALDVKNYRSDGVRLA